MPGAAAARMAAGLARKARTASPGARPEDAQALLIRYDPGAGIGWHRDRPQYAEVLGLSLGAPAAMRLRRRTGGRIRPSQRGAAARAPYLLRGEVRDEWEHSIVPMDGTRRSITLRTNASEGADRPLRDFPAGLTG